MKVACCLQHVVFEGPGVFRRALETRGYTVVNVVVPADGVPSDPGDFLLIMGGPMSVNDPDGWIEAELQFVKTALARDIPVLGICFGAQLLAKALGGSVASGPKFEIGIGSVSLTDIGKIDPILSATPKDFFVFQWHGEGSTLPPGSAHLVTSADFPIQAFRMTDRVYGLLFHLELEEAGIAALCRECPQDVQRGGMTSESIQARSRPHLPGLHQLADRFIDHLLGT
ncbi:MAG TPA: type 1 glutamine amidotransferase [Nitrospirales bacterium]|nr:amidotransferase [Nitrospiraceae bacterium]HNP29818.1 type 1 glutamine amidotransferase [Nitrospirales bacterium]